MSASKKQAVIDTMCQLGPTTSAEICKATGASVGATDRWLKHLHKTAQAHISGWQPGKGGYNKAAVWTLGPGEDAEKHPTSDTASGKRVAALAPPKTLTRFAGGVNPWTGQELTP